MNNDRAKIAICPPMLENEVLVVALLGFVIRVLKTYLKYSGFG
jgi:hypothetical protein